MLAGFKKLLFTPLVTMALFIATVGIKPASFFLWYQPEEPSG
jgi:cyclic lactone autoinducer peptide